MASNRIKGITIEIDGNVTKLNNALADVDKKLATVKTSLRDVDKLLKLDPKNTELLSQKQKLLGEAISGTKERLDKLKAAQEKATDPKDYDALQREIIATEQELGRLQGEYKKLGTETKDAFQKAGDALKKAGEKIKSFGKKAEDLGKKLAPVSGAAAAIGAAAIKSAMDLDEGYDSVIKKTGATGDALEDLKEQVDTVFTNVPTDAKTAGDAVGEVNTRFKVTGKRLGTLSTAFVQFAEITDQDVNTAISGVSDVMKDFNLDQTEAENVMGLLAKTSQDTGIDIGELTGIISTNSETLQAMGLDLGESVTLLGQMEEGGIETSKALSALKKAQQKATKEGKSLKDTLSDSITAIQGAETETEALQIATDTFGKGGAAVMTKAIREGKISVDDLSTSLGDYGDVVEKTYEDTIDPWDQMKVAINNLKLAGSQLAEELFKTLKPIIDKVVESVKAFTQWFSNLNEGQKQTIVKIGLLIAALAPALVIFGKVAQGIGSIIKIGGTLVQGISAISGLLTGGGGLIASIGSLVAAIGPYLLIAAAVVTVGVLIYKNWDKLKKAAKALAKGVSDAVKKMTKAVKDFVKKVGDKLTKGLKDMQDKVSKRWDNIKDKTSKTWGTITTTLSTKISNIKKDVGSKFKEIKENVNASWENVKQKTSERWESIKNAVSAGMKNVRDDMAERFEKVKEVVRRSWTSARNITKKWMENIVNAASNGIKNAGKAMTTAFSDAKQKMTSAFTTVRDAGQKALNAIGTAAGNAFDAVKKRYSGGFGSVINDIKSKFAGIGSAIKTPFKNAWETIRKFPNALRNLFSGVKITLPKFKLPHLRVTWRQLGNFIKIPQISVQWYKKAYEDAVMFNRPTVLQTANGLKGFGDGNGAEVVLGMNKLKQLVGSAGDMNVNMTINAGPGMNVNKLAAEVERRLVKLQQQKAYSMT